MTTQQQSKLYWKDALRQAQIEIEATADTEVTELSPAHNRKWTKAYHQAQADLKDPSAIVWLPDEIAPLISEGVIRQAHPTPETSPAQTRRQRLKALLLALLFLVPAAISYLLAYRRITAHLR